MRLVLSPPSLGSFDSSSSSSPSSSSKILVLPLPFDDKDDNADDVDDDDDDATIRTKYCFESANLDSNKMIDRLCRIRELISIPCYNIYIYMIQSHAKKKERKKERVKREKRTTTIREKKSLVS